MIQRIAVLTSGGDAPGMNAAIRSVVRCAVSKGWTTFGVRNGYQGLIDGLFEPMGTREVGGILQRGGTVLGSARCEEFKTFEGREQAIRSLNRRGVDALVVIGGNGSQAGSFALSFIVAKPAYLAPEPNQVSAVKSFQLSNFLEFKAIPISIIILVISFSYSGVLTFIPLYAKQIHLVEAASFYFLVYAVTVFFSRPLSGRLLDVRGANFVVYPCLLIYAVGMLLFSQASHGIALLLAGVIIGLGYGNFTSSAQAISIKGLPPHRLGLATSTFFIFVDLGFGVGPYLLGSLAPFTGYRGLYLMMAIVILATIPLYYFLYARKASSE